MVEQRTNGAPLFKHNLANWLIAGGQSIFQFLCELGLNLCIARKDNLLEEDLIRRLKNPNEHWEAAAFELNLLSQFINQGFKVEKNYPSGKGKKRKM